jgi:hypothetical protein
MLLAWVTRYWFSLSWLLLIATGHVFDIHLLASDSLIGGIYKVVLLHVGDQSLED